MNLDMWFKDDIRNMLIGIEIASAQTVNGLSDAEQLAFRNGFRAALLAVGASFGIVPNEKALYATTPSPKVRMLNNPSGR